jgi:RNA recognition motif. (a.k.a. RRM, RBD, or RNP domain)
MAMTIQQHNMKLPLPTVSNHKQEHMMLLLTISNHMDLTTARMTPLVMEVEASDMVEITMQVIGREMVVVTMIAMETLVALILEEITIKISRHDRMKVESDTTLDHSLNLMLNHVSRLGLEPGMEKAHDTIYITNLPDSVTEEKLAEVFGSIGIIKHDRKNDKPKSKETVTMQISVQESCVFYNC